MATLKSSINLIDNMSATLNRITGKSDKMTNSIENSQKQMNKRTDFAKNMSRDEQKLELLGAQYNNQARRVERLSQEYENAIRTQGKYHDSTEKIQRQLLNAQSSEMKLADSVEKAGKVLENQDNQFKKNINSSSGLSSKLKSLIGMYVSFRGVKKLLTDTVGAAGELTQRVGVMQAAFGNADVGKNYFNKLQLYAIETRHDIDDLTDATRNFMQITKNTDKLMGLTEQANRLSMRTNNIGSAESLMQEAMRGNFTRMQRTLHLTDSQIDPLKQAVQKGSLDGIIGAFDEALNTAGLTQEIVEAYQNSPIQKFYKAIDKAKLGFARAGEEALMRLEPVLDRLNGWLESASADNFFGAISAGITLIIEGVDWLTNIIVGNWEIIKTILIAISIVYLASILVQLKTIIPQLWATIPPILAQGAAWLSAHWPILIVVGAILIFIGVLRRAGVTADQVTGFIGGVFGGLFAFLHNGVTFVWNIFASFAEFLVNLFIDPTYAIKILFHNLAVEVMGFFNSLFQGIANGLNWLVGKINKVLKTDIGTVQVDFMDNAISTLEKNRPTSDKNVWKATRMEYKDVAGGVNKGYDFGASLPGKFSTGLSSLENSIDNFAGQENAWNNMQGDNLGNLGDIGKASKDLNNTGKDIKKSIDKSEEDLKWMRDLAEQEVINRFTTATLAPQLSFEFGDVKETADVDGIMVHIKNILEEQLAISAEGVHE